MSSLEGFGKRLGRRVLACFCRVAAVSQTQPRNLTSVFFFLLYISLNLDIFIFQQTLAFKKFIIIPVHISQSVILLARLVAFNLQTNVHLAYI